MNKNPKSPVKGIWRHLISCGAAMGLFMGLFEICWVYLLPTFFPNRRYELPVATVGRFVCIAVVVDVLLMIVAAVCLGLLIRIVRSLWRSAYSFRHWSALIRFLLIAGALSYLHIGIVYSYFKPGTQRLKFQVAIAGILPIIVISIVVVWLLGILIRRFGTVASKAVWVLALAVLLCTAAPNYLRYRSKTFVKLDLPTIHINHPPNILLVTLDTLRADHLACYGNKIVKTPVLDEFAADGCVFEAAFAQAPTTTPSHCSIMTSTYLNQHGAINGCAMRVGIPTLAEILQANGYETAAFVSATTVRSTNSGLHRGFDYYEDSISIHTSLFRHDEVQFILADYLLVKLQNSRIPGYIVSNRALPWLNRRRQKPFFLWLHYFDPHSPYDAPYPYKDMYDHKIDSTLPYALLRGRYAGEVTYTDFELGRIIKSLKDKGLYDDMFIIVTSDHGEAFGEKHGDITEFQHGRYLYDTTQHVPLIIKLPEIKGAGQRIKDVVQLVDLAPTVLDYLGIPSPELFKGQSLLDLLNREQRSEPGIAYAERKNYIPPRQALKERRMLAMRTPEIKYICEVDGKHQELYDIVSDPEETINIYRRKPELAKNYYKRIQETLGEPVETDPVTLDPRVIEQLRTLGYIDSGHNGEQEEKK